MYNPIGKRVFDILFSLTILIVLLPFLLFIAFLIKLDSKGPILFIQPRLGKDFEVFQIYKFRTMVDKPRKSAGVVYLSNPEITKTGRILRRYKIDELPQFVNVLIGSMSVVGPRPCLLSTYKKYKNRDTDYRFKVKPGVTSNAGVSGSIFLSWDEKWKKDKDYTERVSLTTDFKIIWKTILVVLFGEKAFV